MTTTKLLMLMILITMAGCAVGLCV